MNFSNTDKKLIWHPFTQEKTAPDPILIDRGEGSYVFDKSGKKYLDLISSWWVNLHGHANEYIAQKIYEQAKKLEHIIFAGYTHEPAIDLCHRLHSILPTELCKFFFSDNGSTAVEVALKMAYQYWQNIGVQGRRVFLSFEGGYHGDTVGAMSVGPCPEFHEKFKGLLFEVISLPYPKTWDDDTEIEQKEQDAIQKIEKTMDIFAKETVAMIFEPLIQGASGMRVARPIFIKKVLEIAKKYEILIIFDEVMTGFGRTGTTFAFEQIDHTPDFLCLSKGLTGGFMPLSLTVTSNKIYEAFLNDDSRYAFLHGHSYTANPIACAAAIASFDLLFDEKTQKSIKNINKTHKKCINLLKNNISSIEKCRILGTISAFETKEDMSKQLAKIFAHEGLLLRPLGKTIYILPPYSINLQQMDNAYEKINDILYNLY